RCASTIRAWTFPTSSARTRRSKLASRHWSNMPEGMIQVRSRSKLPSNPKNRNCRLQTALGAAKSRVRETKNPFCRVSRPSISAGGPTDLGGLGEINVLRMKLTCVPAHPFYAVWKLHRVQADRSQSKQQVHWRQADAEASRLPRRCRRSR